MRAVYKNRYSKAEIVPACVDGVLELIKLNTISTHRNRGHATELMWRIIDDADAECRVLMLHPAAYGLVSSTDLIKFYEKFGFVVIQQKPVIMARQPKIDQFVRACG